MEMMCYRCIKRITGFTGDLSPSQECVLCNNFFTRCNDLCDRIVKELRKYDFNTFNVGCIIDQERKVMEERLMSKYGTPYSKTLKSEINTTLRDCLKRKLGKKVSFHSPDVVVVYDLEKDEFTIRVNPLYIFGVYKKFVRGLPQTKLYCYSCRGKGCESCDYTGLEYPESIESIVCSRVLEFTKGRECVFHGAGREDIDVRNLGGRPFIVEVKEPLVRNIDFQKLQEEINKDERIEVSDLRLSSKQEMVEITRAYHIKEYRALVECPGYPDLSVLERYFKNLVIKQRTPLRVLRRRKDKWRMRTVYSVKTNPIDKNTFELFIVSDPGLYIKEFITGDQGRTIPSVSDVLGKPCKILELDVLKVGA